MKSNPRPKREGHPQPEKHRTESTGNGQGAGDSPGAPGDGGVSMALKDEHG